MDENSRMASKLLEKKTDSYSTDYRNFVAPHEIMVTITLDEYRMLVSNNATRQKDIDAANNDKYLREAKMKELSEANDKLKGENYDLKTEVDSLKDQLEKLSGKDGGDA